MVVPTTVVTVERGARACAGQKRARPARRYVLPVKSRKSRWLFASDSAPARAMFTSFRGTRVFVFVTFVCESDSSELVQHILFYSSSGKEKLDN